jgi:acyl-CoA thioesterase-1
MKLPSNYGPTYTKQFEAMFHDLAREKGIALLPFLLAGVAGRPDLNLPDGIHPNAEGYTIVADTVAKTLVPILRQVPTSARPQDPGHDPS